MTIVRSITPEAKAIYKMRRENLKLLSRTLQLQMKSGAADFDSVNEGLIQLYSANGEHTTFKTFQQRKEEGKFIIRGSKAFTVWGSPKKAACLFFFALRPGGPGCHNATEYFTCRLRLRSTACLPSAATVKYNVAFAATVFY